MSVYDNASEPSNECPEIYFDKYMALSGAKKGTLGNKYTPTNVFLETFNCKIWLKMKNQLMMKMMKNLLIYH